MRCDDARLAISCRIDGEPPGVDPDRLDTHLAGCGACRSFALDVLQLRRAALAPAPSTGVDVTPAVMARVGTVAVPGVVATLVRLATAGLGVVQLVIAAPLLLAHDHHAHEARHIGAFSLALGVGLLYAALRPHRAVGLLPAVITLSMAMVVTCIGGLTRGALPSHAELSHLVAPLAVGGLWWISRCPRPSPARRPALRPVA